LTDGITEAAAVDDAVFGTEGALDFIRSRQQSNAGELAEAVCRAARTFAGGGPQMDDMLSVVCKVE
jgi:serine phosphatase RsbU (regulator of sigma subunit)